MSERPNILLVEDDIDLAESIQEYLESKELKVDLVHDGAEATDIILELQPDLVILDLMLPGKDGIAICKEIRDDYHGAILMLTASADPFDQVVGLEMGADDFVQKPVEPRILLARIRARLRNSQAQGDSSNNGSENTAADIVHGDLTIKPAFRQVFVKSHQIQLTGPEYDILLYLVENTGTILGRDALFKTLRGIEYDGQSRMIDITISQIRQKLGEFNYAPQHIKTVRNKGYLFVPHI